MIEVPLGILNMSSLLHKVDLEILEKLLTVFVRVLNTLDLRALFFIRSFHDRLQHVLNLEELLDLVEHLLLRDVKIDFTRREQVLPDVELVHLAQRLPILVNENFNLVTDASLLQAFVIAHLHHVEGAGQAVWKLEREGKHVLALLDTLAEGESTAPSTKEDDLIMNRVISDLRANLTLVLLFVDLRQVLDCEQVFVFPESLL